MPYKDPDRQREWQRAWIAQRRKDWLTHKCCAHCGTAEQLRIDHIDPAQKVSHRIWSWSDERRAAELAKCQVLCQPCHARKTFENYEHGHGTAKKNAKLTDDLVVEIRRRVEAGATRRGLAREIGVSEKLVRLVVNGDIWRHVEGAADGEATGPEPQGGSCGQGIVTSSLRSGSDPAGSGACPENR